MLVDKNKSVSLLYVGTKLFFHANSAKKKKSQLICQPIWWPYHVVTIQTNQKYKN